MAGLHKLSALAVARTKKPGMYADGGGLYLQVTRDGAGRSWVFRYAMKGREREMGLGSLNDVSLAKARELAAKCREQKRDGIDPIEARRAAKQAEALASAKAMTFKDAATAYIRAHAPSWKNPKHASQWENTLRDYVEPVFGKLSVSAVDTALVLKAIEPIWATKTETASRVRGRVEAILDWATVRGYRQGDNPARWRGHLEKLLPARSRVRAVEHHAALPYAEVAAFMGRLRSQPGVAARALEFTILCASRTGEVISSRWSEIDMDAGVWVIPAERMKAGREHRVALSKPAVELLRKLAESKVGEFVFHGAKLESPLSNMAMSKALERMGRRDVTVHGFRSTFRDWAAERTNFPAEVAEMALAHTVSDRVEAAYRRGDLFEKRRKLMDAWASYCGTPVPANAEEPPATSESGRRKASA